MYPLAICLLTYKRTYEALATIVSTFEHLKYPRELIRWYVADDGSPAEHHAAVLQMLSNQGAVLIGEHNNKFRNDESYNCGKGWNRGLGICHQYSDYVLWLEDDWRMDDDLNITPYMQVLEDYDGRDENHPPVGIVTFRILSRGADVHTVGGNGEMFLRYDRSTQYAYSGNPLIRHARYTKYYGWFAEDRSPGQIELHQDDMYRLDTRGGPQIWRPVACDPWGAWHHIGTEKTWK
jgi:hypothetical protein